MNPYLNFRFRIEINGILEGGCNEFSGVQATTQTEDFREGGENRFVHKFVKETTFDNLVLKKGLGDSDALYRWHRDVVAGKVERRTVTIYLLKEKSDDIALAWSFKDAYPVKWTGPDFKAGDNAVAFESLEMAHHGYAN